MPYYIELLRLNDKKECVSCKSKTCELEFVYDIADTMTLYLSSIETAVFKGYSLCCHCIVMGLWKV